MLLHCTDYCHLLPLQVRFTITVPKAQLEMGPLKWKGLKVSGYTGKVMGSYLDVMHTIATVRIDEGTTLILCLPQ